MRNNELLIEKQVVGIDIGMKSFFACYKVQYSDKSCVIKGVKSFENNSTGLIEFFNWCEKRNKEHEIMPIYVMEATGIYYEELAYFLHYKKQIVSVQLAIKIKYFAKSFNLKTKTDKVDSKMIAEFGIERHLEGTDLWTPPSQDFKMIRDLSREHTSLKQDLSSSKSQLHALNHAHKAYKKVIRFKKKQIKFYETQITAVEKEILRLIKLDTTLHSKIDKIATIKGVGFITIIKVLAETNGFLLFKNIRQLVSYAGLDVIEKESGKFKGKTRISKKGNARIRSALYMPALSASRYNTSLKSFYERINNGRTIKRQGLIAVMRKLLILIYTLWKTEENYVENYQIA